MPRIRKSTTISIGEKDYEVPSMNLDALEEYMGIAIDFPKTIKDQIPAMVKQVKVALSENNPEVTEAEIRKGLDWEGLQTALSAIADISGLVLKQTGNPPTVAPLSGENSVPT